MPMWRGFLVTLSFRLSLFVKRATSLGSASQLPAIILVLNICKKIFIIAYWIFVVARVVVAKIHVIGVCNEIVPCRLVVLSNPNLFSKC